MPLAEASRRRIAGVGGTVGLVGVALALLCGPSAGLAQVPRADAGNSRLVQQVQQLSADRAMLQAENAQLKQQVEQLTKKADAVGEQQRALQQKLQSAQQQADRGGAAQQQDAAALAKLRGQLQDLVAHYRDTIQTMRGIEVDRNALRAKLAASDSSLKTCVDRNANLYLTATQILNKYGHHGFWGCVADKEPFTQISRARLDNLIDAYRQRVDALRLQQAKAGADGPGGGGP